MLARHASLTLCDSMELVPAPMVGLSTPTENVLHAHLAANHATAQQPA